MDKGLDTKFAGKDETRPVPEGYETVPFAQVMRGDYVQIWFTRLGGGGFFHETFNEGYVLGTGDETNQTYPNGIRFINIEVYGKVFSNEEPIVVFRRKKVSTIGRIL